MSQNLAPQWLPKPINSNTLDPKIWSQNAKRSPTGEILIGDIPVSELKQKYGTPLYIVDEADFKHRAQTFYNTFNNAFSSLCDGVDIYYAGKAFLCIAIAKWVAAAGLKLDTCSGGEMRVALRAGIPGKNLGLHGNNKSITELETALEHNLGRIVVDSLSEINTLITLAKSKQTVANVMLRVTPGVQAHTHEHISTAHEDQKFGLSISTGAAQEAAAILVESSEINFLGFHSHIGSQIFDTTGFALAIKRVLKLHQDTQKKYGITIPELDIGGGFGIAYTSFDNPKLLSDIALELADVVRKECISLEIKVPRISLEPGRAIAGPTTCTLYEVGTVKSVTLSEGERNYISVDGGMSDNIRTALYGANYTAVLASRASGAKNVISRIVGKHCESGDIVVRDIYFPEDTKISDLIAVPATGAYCWSLANNFNYLPKPPVVAVLGGSSRLLVRGETEVDLLARDMG